MQNNTPLVSDGHVSPLRKPVQKRYEALFECVLSWGQFVL